MNDLNETLHRHGFSRAAVYIPPAPRRSWRRTLKREWISFRLEMRSRPMPRPVLFVVQCLCAMITVGLVCIALGLLALPPLV